MLDPKWKIFVLGRDKTPLPNCEYCRQADHTHDREACDHLTCHGIYAATSDESRWEQMMMRHPENPWALRCGEASGIIVIDAEGTAGPNGLTGVDVLDQFDQWTGHELQHTDRVATTPSGGVHHYFNYVSGVRSRNRVLPQVDIKSDGGYVVIPTVWSRDRTWLRSGAPAEPDSWLVDWLRSARGRSSGGPGGLTGHTEGYDFDRYLRDGCPGGVRDEFFNELIFRFRKAGYDRATLTMMVREHWKRCEQPPTATWYLPWWNLEYKIERTWKTVEPDPALHHAQLAWANTVDEPVKIGRVTLVRRGER